MVLLIRAISVFANLFTTALLVRALMSWVVGAFRGSGPVRRIYDILCAFTEPIVGPVRNFMHSHFNTGMFDFSIFVTMILVELVSNVLIRVLLMIA